jgi:hypothetical protein
VIMRKENFYQNDNLLVKSDRMNVIIQTDKKLNRANTEAVKCQCILLICQLHSKTIKINTQSRIRIKTTLIRLRANLTSTPKPSITCNHRYLSSITISLWTNNSLNFWISSSCLWLSNRCNNKFWCNSNT